MTSWSCWDIGPVIFPISASMPSPPPPLSAVELLDAPPVGDDEDAPEAEEDAALEALEAADDESEDAPAFET